MPSGGAELRILFVDDARGGGDDPAAPVGGAGGQPSAVGTGATQPPTNQQPVQSPVSPVGSGVTNKPPPTPTLFNPPSVMMPPPSAAWSTYRPGMQPPPVQDHDAMGGGTLRGGPPAVFNPPKPTHEFGVGGGGTAG